MAHTPGPWEAEKQHHVHSSGDYYTVEGRMQGVNRDGVVADTLNRDHVIDPEEDEANARLIAAAPELLELAEEYLAVLKNDWVGDGDIAKVQALVAKAKGTQP